MATYIVRYTGSIEVLDESSKESAIAYVQNFYNLDNDQLEFEAEEVEEVEYDANLYREHKGYKNVNGYAVPIEDEEEYDEDKKAREYEGGLEDYLYDNYVADQLEERDK